MLPPGAAMAPPVDISRSISAFQQIQNSSGDMSRSFSQPLRNHTAYREPSGTGFQNIARKGHRNSVGVLSTSSSIMARTGSGLKRRAHTIGSSQQTTELITIVTGIMNNPLIELPHDAREALRQSVHAQIEPTRLPKRAKGDASSQSAAFQSGQKFECFACGKVKKRQCDLKYVGHRDETGQVLTHLENMRNVIPGHGDASTIDASSALAQRTIGRGI